MEHLGLGAQTFRYWRKHCDPNPERSCFRAQDVLCYRIVKTLIVRKHLKPALLKEFDMTVLFRLCYQNSCATLREQKLVLDLAKKTLMLCEEQAPTDMDNNDLIVLALTPLIEEHLEALLNVGGHLNENAR